MRRTFSAKVRVLTNLHDYHYYYYFFLLFPRISVSLKRVAQPETLAVLRVTLIFKALGSLLEKGDDYEEEHLFADALAPGGV